MYPSKRIVEVNAIVPFLFFLTNNSSQGKNKGSDKSQSEPEFDFYSVVIMDGLYSSYNSKTNTQSTHRQVLKPFLCVLTFCAPKQSFP